MEARDFVRRMWVLMWTVFVDMLGFLIVLPLLPFYAERLGGTPFMVGALVSTFALAQLASAPLWGRLSDRYGRRPMILAGLLFSAASYILFESASTVALLFVSRFVQGAAGGTVGVVQAYVSDSVPSGDRAKALGWLTAATSAGVMVGPAIGSLAAAWGVIGPGYLAASLCVLNFLFGLWWLPESDRSKETRQAAVRPKGATREAMLDVLLYPRGSVGSMVWIYTLGMMAFMAMNGVLALFLERRFGVTEETIGWFFVYVGAASLVMRSLVLGPAVRRFGEIQVLRAGSLFMAIALATVPLARSILEFSLAVIFMPVGTALLFPATTSQVSKRADPSQTGLILGVQQSFGGVARMLGPLWSGALFQHLGIASPFWVAAGLMVFVHGFTTTVRGVEAAPDVAQEVDTPVLPGGKS
jgi:predicted MFS family arabinose efflux permease